MRQIGAVKIRNALEKAGYFFNVNTLKTQNALPTSVGRAFYVLIYVITDYIPGTRARPISLLKGQGIAASITSKAIKKNQNAFLYLVVSGIDFFA